jgi:hypothetical protein
MYRSLFPVLLIAATGSSAQAPSDGRFSGSARLQAAAPASADGRFALSADLQPAAAAKANGRFDLNAHLKPGAGAKLTATACGGSGVTIFSNGFEN